MSETLIQKYLDGLMDNQERSQFEAQINSDLELSKQLSLHKDMRKFADQQIQNQTALAAIEEVGKTFIPSLQTKTVSIKKKSNWRYFVPVAAAALIILGLFIRPLFNSNPLELITYDASPLSFQERGQASNELLSLSADAFNNGKYDLAVTHLNGLIESNQDVDKARLYKSIALLNTGNHVEARAELKLLETVDMFDNASYFYQGLSHLDTGDASLAKRLFNLVKENSSYYNRAQQRLKQLSEL